MQSDLFNKCLTGMSLYFVVLNGCHACCVELIFHPSPPNTTYNNYKYIIFRPFAIYICGNYVNRSSINIFVLYRNFLLIENVCKFIESQTDDLPISTCVIAIQQWKEVLVVLSIMTQG